MFRRGNMGAVREAAKKAKERQQDGGWTRRLNLNDGESVRVYLTAKADPGPDDVPEPYIHGRHYFQPGRFYFLCSGETTCPACLAFQRGNTKQFKDPQHVHSYNVVDIDIYHKTPTTEKNTRRKFDFNKCSEDIRCHGCKKNKQNEGTQDDNRVYGGRKLLTLAETHSDLLRAQDSKLAEHCANCFTGKIKVYEFQCSNCGDSLDWVPESDEYAEDVQLTCPKCKTVTNPYPAVECSGCDSPLPATLYDYGAPVIITRVGDGQKTTYNFSVEWPPPEVEEWVTAEDQQPYNLDKVCMPEETPEQLAAKLGISPGTQQGYETYAEENPFDEDRSAKPTPGAAGRLGAGGRRAAPPGGTRRLGAGQRVQQDDVPF